jgi:TPR repeat protein
MEEFRMERRASRSEKTRQAKAHETFLRADKQQELGNLRSGFRLLLSAAKMGDTDAQVNLGYTYDVGLGVRRNRSAALFWYEKAYRKEHGCGVAASNIGTIYRDEQNFAKAIPWFRRAVQYGNVDANLELAKIYLRKRNEKDRALQCLQNVLDATPPIGVGEDTQDEARLLLQQLVGAET